MKITKEIKQILSKNKLLLENYQNGLLLQNYYELKNDKEFVIEAVKQNGLALEYVSEELKANKEVVFEAVKQNGWALQYASYDLRNDVDVVLEAVKQDGDAFDFALNALKEAFMISLVSRYFKYTTGELSTNKN